MPPSAVVTVRIEGALLAALKQRAAREETSVSAQIVRLVRESVTPGGAATEPPRRPRPTSGMFSDLESPDLDELKALRRRFSAELLAGTGPSLPARRAPASRDDRAERPRRARRARV